MVQKSVLRRLLVCVLIASHCGCLAMTPLMGGPCRDPSTGRFVSCGGGGSSTGSSGSGSDGSGIGTGGYVAIGLGVAALFAAGVYLYATLRSPSPAPVSSGPGFITCSASDTFTVRICESVLGYRLGLPLQQQCPEGSRFYGTETVACASTVPRYYHACITGPSGWVSRPATVSCASMGWADAPGNFVPPGRSATDGVGP